MKKMPCAFCKGKGKDPFDLLSEQSACQVCGGAGEVAIIEPAIKCAFCKGTGVHPHGARVTCTVCNGKGMVAVKGATKACAKCEGTGMVTDSGLPCTTCGGKGRVAEND